MSKELLQQALDALEQIALAGMSGTGQESPDGMRDWHARRAWEFIGIAARAAESLRAELAKPEPKPFFPFRECEDSQAGQPAQEPRPPNCGTGHCSCIEGYDPAYLAMVRGIGGKA